MSRSRRGFGGRLLEAIERRLPAEDREFLVGDLLEEVERRRDAQGLWRSRWWGLRQVIGLIRHGWLAARTDRPRRAPAGRISTREGVGVKSFVQSLGQLGSTFYGDLKLGSRKLLRSPVPSLVIKRSGSSYGRGRKSTVSASMKTRLLRPIPSA
ncbi:MAG: hypothetical protein AAFY88_29345, partial [Acidobacteriota bacterium]